MALLKIARMGHPVLSRPALAVADPGAAELRRLAADMIETMEDAGGVGLAAPQVHRGLRLFVYRLPADRAADGRAIGATVLVNPTLHRLDDARERDWEGCLSMPGLRGAVPRWRRIGFEATDLDGHALRGVAEGFHARVLQHEQDHLDGVLYPARMDDFTLFGFEDEMGRHQIQPGAQPDAEAGHAPRS